MGALALVAAARGRRRMLAGRAIRGRAGGAGPSQMTRNERRAAHKKQARRRRLCAAMRMSAADDRSSGGHLLVGERTFDDCFVGWV